MTRYRLPLEIEPLEEGGYLAICPILQGCHAEGWFLFTSLTLTPQALTPM